ncbi:MAG: hypothetical protein ABTQ32_40285 [Myxococcaceae bacterium]
MKPRTVRRFVLVVLLSGCGSLTETAEPSTDGGATMGLFCAADDPCTCTPCTATSQCASGLSCLPGRRKSENCADGRLVCTGP